MKSEEKVKKLMGRQRQRDALKLRSRLQVRMTLSFVGASIATPLLVELLLILLFVFVILRLPFVDTTTMDVAKNTAQVYALEAAVQGGGVALDPHTTFQPGQPSSLAVPEQPTSSSSSPARVAFVLLIAPTGQVLASSDPVHYPVATSAASLLPGKKQLILNTLAGIEGKNMVEITSEGHVAFIAQPVESKEKKPIGAIYVQMAPTAVFSGNIFMFAEIFAVSVLFGIILTAPVSALFGWLTTRGLVRRLHHLVLATGQFANGDYTQRVPIAKRDEIGQLESQFNQMAEQLVESIAQQQTLVEQHARMEERTRIEQELRVAQIIQRTLLPKDLPALPGWQLAAYYQPARAVGGDFYDFLYFEDGRLGLVIGDVTDKGVPAALVMATTRSILRSAASGGASPGKVLAQANELLCSDIPPKMFVTCLYAILDPSSGQLQYANAGHDLPYLRHKGEVSELRATGMPLGLMPGMYYEEKETMLAHGDRLLLYSDGLVEAHNAKRAMFSFPYLMALLEENVTGQELIDFLLSKLAAFTGPDWEQEDDVTLVTLQRAEGYGVSAIAMRSAAQFDKMDEKDTWQTLDEWEVPSQLGNERMALERVAEAVKALHLPTKQLEQIKTAVAEATMNAMEHGNHYQADVPVAIQVFASQTALAIRIRDQGGSKPIPAAKEPDLEAKLAELQTPRGWGLFLIKNMVDEMNVSSDETHHTIELIVYLQGESHA